MNPTISICSQHLSICDPEDCLYDNFWRRRYLNFFYAVEEVNRMVLSIVYSLKILPTGLFLALKIGNGFHKSEFYEIFSFPPKCVPYLWVPGNPYYTTTALPTGI